MERIVIPEKKYSKRELLLEYQDRLKAELSLHEFVKQAWHILEPDTPFVDGWHIRAICDHLEAVTRGDILNLIINVPPRTCKSTLVSVMWPVWWWIRQPGIRFIFASHSEGLAVRDSMNCKLIIESDWYQERWGDRFSLATKKNLVKNTQKKFENNRRGVRQCASVGGKITGEGAHVLVGDDLNDMSEIFSDTVRDGTNRWFSSTFSSRVNDRKTARRVIMAQRGHEMDVTGYALKNDNKWVHFYLPMEFEEKNRCRTVSLPSLNGKVWEDPRISEGQLLWPEKEGRKEVEDRKKELADPYMIAGQLQQRPSPEEGGIFLKKWFKLWEKEHIPQITHIIQSWDTALEDKETSAFSACVTYGLFIDERGYPCVILLGAWEGKLPFPQLRRMAVQLFKDYRNDGSVEVKTDLKYQADRVIIEQKASGHCLMQDFFEMQIPVEGFDPKPHGDKTMRAHRVTDVVHDGFVYLPTKPPEFTELRNFSNLFMTNCLNFPNGISRDMVDAAVQGLLYLKERNYFKFRGFEERKTGHFISKKAHYGIDK